MAGGWQALGDVLGGGASPNSITNVKAFQEGRYRSAQTEEALAQAKVRQQEALDKERQNALLDKIASAQGRGVLADELLPAILASGHGSDFSAIQSGLNSGQTRDYREQLAAPGVSPERTQELRAALGDAPFNPVEAVGTHGAYRDARNPDAGIQLSDELIGGDPTPAITNFEYWLHHGKDPAFGQFARPDQLINAGGVTYVKPGVGSGPVTAPVSTATTAGNAGAIAGAKTTATEQSKLANALPGVEEQFDNLDKSIADLLAKPGFDQIYGVQGAIDPRNYIPGTAGADAKAARDNIDAQTFGIAIQKMRGLGQLSNAEGSKVQAAFTRAQNPKLSPEEAALAWGEVRTRVARLRSIAEIEAGQKNATQPSNTVAAPQVPTFKTEAEAEAAGLKPGTKVIIGGVSGTWQ